MRKEPQMTTHSARPGVAPDVHSDLVDLTATSLAGLREETGSALAEAIRQVAEENRTGAVKSAGWNSKTLTD
jgi:hypothetical protein